MQTSSILLWTYSNRILQIWMCFPSLSLYFCVNQGTVSSDPSLSISNSFYPWRLSSLYRSQHWLKFGYTYMYTHTHTFTHNDHRVFFQCFEMYMQLFMDRNLNVRTIPETCNKWKIMKFFSWNWRKNVHQLNKKDAHLMKWAHIYIEASGWI